MSWTQGSIVWHWVHEFLTLWKPTTLPDSMVIPGRTSRPTSRAHLAWAVTRHSGFRRSTRIMIAAAARPRTIPAPATQRITFSVLPEKRPSWDTLLASVGVVAVVVELQLGHLVGVLADLLREGERHERGALVVVADLAVLLVRVNGAELHQFGPLVLLVVLLVGRVFPVSYTHLRA